ncbi:hypothetical protein, partial [Methylobacterium oryzisoli]|uniref:hypothetical protein n=1 Tax=Methylobacterium oryzisoli TaxID=3385502 RepID=UPI003891DA81
MTGIAPRTGALEQAHFGSAFQISAFLVSAFLGEQDNGEGTGCHIGQGRRGEDDHDGGPGGGPG